MDQPAAKTPLKPKDYKSALKPVWCPGCGDFAVLNAITKALAFMELPREKVALITGIGCSSRIAAYTSLYGFHGVHGRAHHAAPVPGLAHWCRAQRRGEVAHLRLWPQPGGQLPAERAFGLRQLRVVRRVNMNLTSE